MYIDLFAGYEQSKESLLEYVPIIEKHPDKFLLGTDRGYGVGYNQAAEAFYVLLEELSPETACKVAFQNFQKLMNDQPPTKRQIETICELSSKLGKRGTQSLNKYEAHLLIFELEKAIKE
ncbi:hypothetical protein ACFSCX_00730 [Bacillus salitolerans]|uniref:Amidohydrolase-related domain-containing protein n=1 Tax=Bacillus salitolerans TaxID=1437434 RepID=A0ABW4LIR7_9BACI